MTTVQLASHRTLRRFNCVFPMIACLFALNLQSERCCRVYCTVNYALNDRIQLNHSTFFGAFNFFYFREYIRFANNSEIGVQFLQILCSEFCAFSHIFLFLFFFSDQNLRSIFSIALISSSVKSSSTCSSSFFGGS